MVSINRDGGGGGGGDVNQLVHGLLMLFAILGFHMMS